MQGKKSIHAVVMTGAALALLLASSAQAQERKSIRLASGALLIDTPGMRELQLWSDGSGVSAAFADVEALAEQCRFRDCVHVTEPGCAVLAALASGALDAARLESYRGLRREGHCRPGRGHAAGACQEARLRRNGRGSGEGDAHQSGRAPKGHGRS